MTGSGDLDQELNSDQPFELCRDELVAMLDEFLKKTE